MNKLTATIPPELDELFSGKSRHDEDPMNQEWFKKLEENAPQIDKWLTDTEVRLQRKFIKRHKLPDTIPEFPT